MVKSLLIDDSVHNRIIELQEILEEEYSIKMNLSTIADKLIDNPKEIAKRWMEKQKGD